MVRTLDHFLRTSVFHHVKQNCVFHRICIKNNLVIFVAQNNSIFSKNKREFLQISSKIKQKHEILMYLLHYVTCNCNSKKCIYRQWFSGRCWQSFHVIRSEFYWAEKNLQDSDFVFAFMIFQRVWYQFTEQHLFSHPPLYATSSPPPIPVPVTLTLLKYLLNCNTNHFLILVSATTTLRMSFKNNFMFVT